MFNELCIPCAGKGSANGESRAEIGVGVVVASGIDSHAGRTVGEHSRGDAESRNGLCGAGGTGHTLGMSAYHAIVGCRCNSAVAAYYEHGFLLERHGFEHFVDVVGS